MATTSKLVTYEEWLNMPEVSDEIEEVVNGEIVRMPPPKNRHVYVVDSLHTTLKRQVDGAQVKHVLPLAAAGCAGDPAPGAVVVTFK